MKKRHKKVPTEFAPETSFTIVPAPAAPFRGTQETELDRLKDRLLRELLADAGDPELYAAFRRASNEAAALAWTTPFPLFALPELLREKSEAARRYTRKQAALLERKVPVMGRAV